MIANQYNIAKSRRRIFPRFRGGSRVRLEWVLCIIALAIVIFTAVFFKLDFAKIAFGNLQHIHLEGEYKHLERQVLEDILAPAIGQNLLDIDLNTFEQRLSQMPWVKSVFIQRLWPNKLSIHIEERKAVARWHDQGLVDQSGEVFFAQIHSYSELPSIITAQDRSKSALAFYYYLQEMFEDLGIQIVYLIEDPSYSWEIGLQTGYALKLGRSHLKERIQRFVSAYSTGLHQVIDKVQCVDLRYPDGFAVGWKIKGEQRIC